jgi:hypothetical protein
MFIASIYVVIWEVLHRKSFVVEMLQNGYSRTIRKLILWPGTCLSYALG